MSEQNIQAGLTRAERQAASLVRSGYTEATEHGRFRVGCRVRHVGEQYPEARDGTATIERIFVHEALGHMEMIVKRDRPQWGPTDTHGFWANYHTVLIHDGTTEP